MTGLSIDNENTRLIERIEVMLGKLSTGELASYLDFRVYHPNMSLAEEIEILETFIRDKQSNK